jgi:hypothetical protein
MLMDAGCGRAINGVYLKLLSSCIVFWSITCITVLLCKRRASKTILGKINRCQWLKLWRRIVADLVKLGVIRGSSKPTDFKISAVDGRLARFHACFGDS